MRGSRGGVGGSGPSLEFAKLNIADITGNEKISYFSHLCTSTVIRQTESILLKVGPPPWKNFLDPRLYNDRIMIKKSSIVDSLIMPVIKPNFYLEQS